MPKFTKVLLILAGIFWFLSLVFSFSALAGAQRWRILRDYFNYLENSAPLENLNLPENNVNINLPDTNTAAGDEDCVLASTGKKLSFAEAKKIADKSSCATAGKLLTQYFCNENSGTWWIDLDATKAGCAPACVIDVTTKKAEINWRCTGLIIPE